MSSCYDRFAFLCRSRPLFRGELKKQAAAAAVEDTNAQAFQRKAPTKYVPFIPPQLLKETFNFIEKKANIRALLDIICAPLKPTETLKQREEFTREWEIYKERRRVRQTSITHKQIVAAAA